MNEIQKHWVEMLKYFVDIYDEKIRLDEYWGRMFPGETFSTTMKCKLHHEEHGESFSYSKNLGMWSCFGRCHTGGKTVAFHKRYMQLKNPKFSTVDALNTLRVLFPQYNLPDVTVALRVSKTSTVNTNKISIKNIQNRLNEIKKSDERIDNSNNINNAISLDVLVFKNFVESYIFNVENRGGVNNVGGNS